MLQRFCISSTYQCVDPVQLQLVARDHGAVGIHIINGHVGCRDDGLRRVHRVGSWDKSLQMGGGGGGKGERSKGRGEKRRILLIMVASTPSNFFSLSESCKPSLPLGASLSVLLSEVRRVNLLWPEYMHACKEQSVVRCESCRQM